MIDYYFTFESNHGADPNGYIKITAPTVEDARTVMFQIHGNKWAFCYTDETLKKEYFPKGEMAHYTVEFLGNYPIPVLLYANGYTPPGSSLIQTREDPDIEETGRYLGDLRRG